MVTNEFYAPPETFGKGIIDTEKYDVFCLGVLMISIIFGDINPFLINTNRRASVEG